MQVKLSIIIPAFNEEARILSTIDTVLAWLATRHWTHEILVVDDGSTDATASVIDDAISMRQALHLVRAPRNQGKGASVRLGAAQAQGEIIGFIDADDKTDIAAIDEVMRRLDAGADIVIGDRTLAATSIAVERRAWRQWGSHQFRRLVRGWMGLAEFSDTQCGFKFYRAGTLHDLQRVARIDGYMFDVELLLLAQRAEYRIERIPVCWRDDPDSRFHPVSGSWRNMRELLRIRRLHR